MPELKDKLEGKTKKVVGRVTGDKSLERKGVVQETKGKIEGVVKDAKRALR
ncbi:MAG: CsbD family protein [Thermoplasmatota archaeon]